MIHHGRSRPKVNFHFKAVLNLEFACSKEHTTDSGPDVTNPCIATVLLFIEKERKVMTSKEQSTSLGDASDIRERLMNSVLVSLGETTPTISDPFWTSRTGHNAGRAAKTGYRAALQIIENTVPLEGETGSGYLARVGQLLEKKRGEFYRDPDDEDGFACGAVRDVETIVDKLRDSL